MTLLLQLCPLWMLLFADVVASQTTFSQKGPGLKLECAGSVMKVTLDRSLVFGSQIDVDAVNGSEIVPLKGPLAARCGYSIDFDPLGDVKIYTSLLSCFTQNQGDVMFDVGLRLRLLGRSENVLEVKKTCSYNEWATREILCERNFMEVSVNKLHPEMAQSKQPTKELNGVVGHLTNKEIPTSQNRIWRVVFYTPKEKPMMLEEVQSAGYSVSTTPTRLVLRTPYNMPELYSENVNGVQMEVFKVTAYFKWAWSVTLINAAAVCPTGGLSFTNNIITWRVPRYITPLMTSDQHKILELHMGIDGQRLDREQMRRGSYDLTMTESQIIISMPVGGPDGYYKSYALDYVYHVAYNIEPMLEMLWREGKSEITRYRVHYPITTPPEARPPYIVNNTVPESGQFEVVLGTFLSDVELVNITFATGVMTVDKANERGFNVQQHKFSNGSKSFRVQIPFSDPVVLRSNNKQAVTYTLPIIFGLIILPESTPFSHPAVLEAIGEEITLPTVSVHCDEENFYTTIEYGNQGKNFNIRVGKSTLSADLYELYRVQENATHLSMALPFLAQDVAFEHATSSSLKSRVDLQLVDPISNWHLKNFSMSCIFPMTMTECFSNGSITALAVKMDSATNMVPKKLTLIDPACKPTFSNSRLAYFKFDASHCGTSRTFEDGTMTYWNEISMGDEDTQEYQTMQSQETIIQPEYRVEVTCTYKLSTTQVLAFSTQPRPLEIIAEPGFGELHVRMRLAKDASFLSFYDADDSPMVQYLKRPLFFEVELMFSIDPRIELILNRCWASDVHATMNWDLIVNGCLNPGDHHTRFHLVTPNEQVPVASHVKRFEVKMFTFFKDNMASQDQIIVHCEAVICDVHRSDPVCNRQCLPSVPGSTNVTVQRTKAPQRHYRTLVSSGQILLGAS